MDNGDTLHLLVLVGSSHDAEVLASSLRNAGYAVRHKHIQGGEDLTQALEEQIWDMLITSPKVGDFTAQQALETINHVGKDIPGIVFGSEVERKSAQATFV